MSNPIISLRNASLYFPERPKLFGGNKSEGFWALNDITLDVYEGETLGIIGHNGSGKSTLLKLMAGVYEPDGGSIVTKEDVHIELMAIGKGFESTLTGRENAILNGLLLGKSTSFIREHMDAIIEFAELEEFIDKPVYTYSSGMSSRLGFAVAYHAQPDVILIDEVLGVGDEAFKEKSRDAIRQLLRSNKTVVLISHDRKTIQNLCTRAVLLEKSRQIRTGPTEEICAEYAERVKATKAARRASERHYANPLPEEPAVE